MITVLETRYATSTGGVHIGYQIGGQGRPDLVELPGLDHDPWVGDSDTVLAEIRQLVTGRREPSEPDRVLATVLFTDIVDWTAHAAWLASREVLVSRTVVDLVAGPGIDFTDRCPHSLKGVPSEWQFHAVKG